jgi:hypothetical protein
MRRSITAALAALVLAPAVRADDKERPIPQNPEQQEKRFRDKLAWNQRNLIGAYDKVGKKDARWDKPARESLDAAARFFGFALDPQTKLEQIYAPAKRAIDAGCDDPLILYLYARSSYLPNYPGPEELERRYTVAAAAMERGSYAPLNRAAALYNAGREKASRKDLKDDVRKEAARLLDAAVALLPKSFEEEEHTIDMENSWYDMLVSIIKAHRRLTGDNQAAFDHVDAVLAESPALKAIRLQVKGNFLIDSAWEARGDRLANTVTKEGWQKFGERLTEARKVLEEAWTAKPGDRRTANLMLTVEKGIGGDRDEMEKWFERAMKADGNDTSACQAKLDWLSPKWHGSREEVLAFGRACRDTKNWRAGITLLVVDAHLAVEEVLPPEEQSRYLRSEEVSNDVKMVYEEYLKHYPEDYLRHSYYAVFCFIAGRFEDAHKHFQIAGDHLAVTKRFPKQWVEQVRAYVAKVAARKQQDKSP